MGIETPIRPYAFERIFALSSTDAERSPQDQALRIVALQAEIAHHLETAGPALAKAHADGFAAGLALARGDTATAMLRAEAALVEGITRLETNFVATETRIAAAAAEVAMSAAEMLAARAIAADPCQAIDAAIGRVLGQIGFRETLHVHAHPGLVEPLQALFESRGSLAQRPLSIVLHADPAIPIGDAHILWDAGGLHLDAAARTAAVRDALGLESPPA